LQNAQDHPGDKLDAGIIRWYIITGTRMILSVEQRPIGCGSTRL
jgi:hypothetical protein